MEAPPNTTWTIDTFYGLFHQGRTLTVTAPSRFEAELAFDAQLAEGEWFPSFRAARS